MSTTGRQILKMNRQSLGLKKTFEVRLTICGSFRQEMVKASGSIFLKKLCPLR